MNTYASFKSIAQAIRHDIVSIHAATHVSHKLTHNDFASCEINRVYESDSFSALEVALIRQYQEIDKRLAPPTGSLKADKECWARFQNSQRLCKRQNDYVSSLRWNSKPDSWLFNILLTAAGFINEAVHDVLDSYDHDEPRFERVYELIEDNADVLAIPVSGFNTGPGVCASIVGTDMFNKFPKHGTLSFSSHDSKRLELIQDELFQHVILNHEAFKKLDLLMNRQNAVKNCYVPKDGEVSRDIAPQLNGDLLFQYPIATFLEQVLECGFGIKLDTQPDTNRQMARKGSLYGPFDLALANMLTAERKPVWCTLDLKTASHIVGVSLGKFFFPQWMTDQMLATRNENILDCRTGQRVKLECMATMGNAYCFPMQTLVFAAICKACNQVMGVNTDWFSVFGDDIIIDRAVYPLVVKVLMTLHMVPNIKKSFHSGYFRESCGGDYFNGYQVRPVSPRGFSTLTDVYAFTNQIVDWYEEHNVVPSDELILVLAKTILETHRAFNKRRSRKLKNGAKGSFPFFIVPRFANMSDGFRVNYQTVCEMQSKDCCLADGINTEIIWFDNAPFCEQYQTQVVKYPYLSIESCYKLVTENDNNFEMLHFLKTSGQYIKRKKDGRMNFHVAGRSDGRAVQRKTEIPSSQWDTDPTKTVSFCSIKRGIFERRLLHALLCYALPVR